jgi:hypothetical protein
VNSNVAEVAAGLSVPIGIRAYRSGALMVNVNVNVEPATFPKRANLLGSAEALLPELTSPGRSRGV